MRLKKVQTHLQKLGVTYKYSEKEEFGKIRVGNILIKETWLNWRKKSISIMVDEINMIDEEQVIGWINHNLDRLK